jgi:polyisoprenoid-binding protein YceI
MLDRLTSPLALTVAILCAGAAQSARHAPAPSLAAADTVWAADTGHSSAEFDVTHFGISHVKGTIPIVSALATIPAGAHRPSSITATLDLRRVDTHNTRRDNDLRSDHWFDVAKFPTMTFASTSVSGTSDSAFAIVGSLTFHGVTKPVTLAATFSGRAADQQGRAHIAYTATTTIDRRDFGLTGNPTVVGTTIGITLEIEAEPAPSP